MFTHARMRLAAAAFAALVTGNLIQAQTGPSLLVAPFPKEQFTDARGGWTYEDAGHVKGSDDSLRLGFYETAGRVRLFPGNLTSPRVGWEFQYIDIRGNPDLLPGQLTDQSVGVAFPVAKVDEWIFGVALGLGYAGASLWDWPTLPGSRPSSSRRSRRSMLSSILSACLAISTARNTASWPKLPTRPEPPGPKWLRPTCASSSPSGRSTSIVACRSLT